MHKTISHSKEKERLRRQSSMSGDWLMAVTGENLILNNGTRKSNRSKHCNTTHKRFWTQLSSENNKLLLLK